MRFSPSRICAAIFIFFLCTAAHGATVKVGHLEIELASPKAPAVEDPTQSPPIDWKKVCSNLGKAFVVNEGIFLQGLAKTYGCTLDGQVVVKPPKRPSKTKWRLKIHSDDSGMWHFVVHFQEQAEALSTLGIKGEDKMGAALLDPAVTRLIAWQLMDSLPMVMWVKSTIKQTTRNFPVAEQEKTLLPAKPYNIFKVTYIEAEKRFATEPMGTATVAEAPPPKKKKKSKAAASDQAGPKEYLWKINWTSKTKRSDVYWAQSVDGAGSQTPMIRAKLAEALERHDIAYGGLAAAISDTVANGYLGIRYGYPISKGDNLISKASMVGILAEIRGGPLEGLRWYWDFVPKVEEKEAGEKIDYTWSRPSLGWSFGLDLNGFLSRLDMTPKIGVMDFDATFPVEAKSGKKALNLRLRNAGSLGIELGAEAKGTWFHTRIWVASDVSGGMNMGGTGTVTSLRGGLDTYWHVYTLNEEYVLNLLVFASGEQLTLQSDISPDDNNQVLAIKEASFLTSFLGLGAALSW